jgi:hypothetical protein
LWLSKAATYQGLPRAAYALGTGRVGGNWFDTIRRRCIYCGFLANTRTANLAAGDNLGSLGGGDAHSYNEAVATRSLARLMASGS